MSYHHAHAVARQARFNNCPVISLHRDANMRGQTQWDILIGTTSMTGFRESVAPTKAEALERARDIAKASDGFITEIYAQRGRSGDMRKVSLT